LRHFPSRDEWVTYLEHYAEDHRLRVQVSKEVLRVDRDDGLWRVQTSEGDLAARNVVVATGYDRVGAVGVGPMGAAGFEPATSRV
jgi:cation diffusion facilitator CzcD-associated flavoprotein CzcO